MSSLIPLFSLKLFLSKCFEQMYELAEGVQMLSFELSFFLAAKSQKSLILEFVGNLRLINELLICVTCY